MTDEDLYGLIEVDSVDAFVREVAMNGPLCEVFIDTSIQERETTFVGFPLHHAYSAKVEVTLLDGVKIIYDEEPSDQHPDREKLRCQARVRAMMIGLETTQKLSQINGEVQLKINDLPLEAAVQQLETYQQELARVEEEHAAHVWM